MGVPHVRNRLRKLTDAAALAFVLVATLAVTVFYSIPSSLADFSGAHAGSGRVDVYVIDTGYTPGQPFKPNSVTRIDFTRDPLSANKDCAGHGTRVAGFIASENRTGSRYNLFSLKASPCYMPGTGIMSYDALVNALQWVKDHRNPNHASIVNMSLVYDGGFVDEVPGLAQVGRLLGSRPTSIVKDLLAEGVTVVAAAGNSTEDACRYEPANIPGVISVGALTRDYGPASYSNWGRCVTTWVVGELPDPTSPSRTHRTSVRGTSFAAALVTGLIAERYAEDPAASSDDIRSWLRQSERTALSGQRYLPVPSNVLWPADRIRCLSVLGPDEAACLTGRMLVDRPGWPSVESGDTKVTSSLAGTSAGSSVWRRSG